MGDHVRSEPVPLRRERSIRVGRGLVVKRFHAAERELALTEAAVQQAAAAVGAAPRLLALQTDDAGRTSLTSERVSRPWPARARTQDVQALALTLARLHGATVPRSVRADRGRRVPRSLVVYCQAAAAHLKVVGDSPVLEPGERALIRSWRGALQRGLLPHARDLERCFGRARLALCHGDLKRSNLRRSDDAVLLIDFEAARLADPAWDLADACLTLGLTAELEDALLDCYREATAAKGSLLVRWAGYRLAGLVFFPVETLLRIETALVGRHAFQGHSAIETAQRLADRGAAALSLLVGQRVSSLAPVLKRLLARLGPRRTGR